MRDLDLIRDHLVWCRRRNLADSTVYQRTRVLARLRRALDGTPLLDATTEQLEATMDGKTWQPCSRRAEISHMRAFYGWARWAKVRDDDPSIDLVVPHVPRGLPRPIEDVPLWRALAIAERPMLTILMLAAFAGLRAKEISGVRVEHVLLQRRRPTLMVPAAKGGDAQAVFLHPVLAAELGVAVGRAEGGWLFPRCDGRPGPWLPWSISQRANTFLHRDVGVPDTLHSLRHWFGTNLLDVAGGNVRVAQDGLRHRSLASTSIYTLIHDGTLADAIAGLPTSPQDRAAAVADATEDPGELRSRLRHLEDQLAALAALATPREASGAAVA